MKLNRRKFIVTLSGIVAAPAIVKADNIMRVISPKEVISLWRQDYVNQMIINEENPLLTISHKALIEHDWRAGTIDDIGSPRWLHFKLIGQGFIDLAKKELHQHAMRPKIELVEKGENGWEIRSLAKPIRQASEWKPTDYQIVTPTT